MGGPSLSFTMAKLTDFQTGFSWARAGRDVQVANRTKIRMRRDLGMVGGGAEDDCDTGWRGIAYAGLAREKFIGFLIDGESIEQGWPQVHGGGGSAGR
jgi:hypothetical protein